MRRVGMGLLGLVLLVDRPSLELTSIPWPIVAGLWPWLARLPFRYLNRRSIFALLCVDTCVFISISMASQAHPLVLLTVAIVLSSATVALLGPSVLIGWLVVAVATCGAMSIVLPPANAVDAPAAAILAAALLWSMCLWLAHMSYRKSRHLGLTRLSAVQRVDAVQRFNRRLQRYLPSLLVRLLVRSPTEPLPLARVDAVIAFVDLVGFTRLCAQRSTEQLASALGRFITMANEQAEAHGGIVVRVLGDAVLVLFPLSENVGQSTAQRAAQAFSARLLRSLARHSMPLEARAGLASGECLVGDWGGERLEFTAIGDPVNRAARLQQLAVPGEVRCDWLDESLAPASLRREASR